MKAGKVLDVLGITRPTLKRYRDSNKIKYTKLPNGQFFYDDDSVFNLKNKGADRYTVLYISISNEDSKISELKIKEYKEELSKLGYKVNRVLYDNTYRGSGFDKLVDLVSRYKVKYVIVINDLDSNPCTQVVSFIFKKFGAKLLMYDEIAGNDNGH